MKEFDIGFVRLNFIKPLLNGLYAEYAIKPDELGIPSALLEEPLTLIPVNVANRWFEQAEHLSQDPLFMLKLTPYIGFENVELFNKWVYHTPDFVVTFRRINYGCSMLQSGCSLSGLQSGNIVKWAYNNPYASHQARLHDSLRMAIMMVNMLRYYLGEEFTPLQVNLTGPAAELKQLEAFFGCKVKQSSAQTEVWLNASVTHLDENSQWERHAPLRLNDAQLDEYINIPQPHDTVKSLYSLINFSRYYGRPNVDFLADCLSISRQQLQRRLLAHGWNFSAMTANVLCNEAVQYLFKGYDINNIAQRLSYSNEQSFCRAFKRLRGVTPYQYLQKLKAKT
ncbi:AraC family transcriptional regulator [Agarivorans sp. OAG1]|uniref:AraC family transcriptional regulator n=1 Tax=Agarivorans sp. OAG1 TaxID=3082387 RepID=UPI002B27F812|nr:AraC family transcriptional regulator [Agarivorans sp. OAG1]